MTSTRKIRVRVSDPGDNSHVQVGPSNSYISIGLPEDHTDADIPTVTTFSPSERSVSAVTDYDITLDGNDTKNIDDRTCCGQLDMKKFLHPSLHFRHHNVPERVETPACCRVVDVCVNPNLVDAIRDGRQTTGIGTLVRLHWEPALVTEATMTTLRVYETDTEEGEDIKPQAAAILATDRLVLYQFARDMLGMYSAELVAVCYPPLQLIFRHVGDFRVKALSSIGKLTGLLDGLFSQCSPPDRPIGVRFTLESGIQSQLSVVSPCRCFTQSQVMVSIGVQTNYIDTVVPSQLQLDESQDMNQRGMIENRLTDLSVELSQQRQFVQCHLEEQRKENAELKHILQEIERNLSQNKEVFVPSTDKKKGGSVREGTNDVIKDNVSEGHRNNAVYTRTNVAKGNGTVQETKLGESDTSIRINADWETSCSDSSDDDTDDGNTVHMRTHKGGINDSVHQSDNDGPGTNTEHTVDTDNNGQEGCGDTNVDIMKDYNGVEDAVKKSKGDTSHSTMAVTVDRDTCLSDSSQEDKECDASCNDDVKIDNVEMHNSVDPSDIDTSDTTIDVDASRETSSLNSSYIAQTYNVDKMSDQRGSRDSMHASTADPSEEHTERGSDRGTISPEPDDDDREIELDHMGPRKGPIIKEIVGDELRSLSPPRTRTELKYGALNKRPTGFRNTAKSNSFTHNAAGCTTNHYQFSSAPKPESVGSVLVDEVPYDDEYFDDDDFNDPTYQKQGAYPNQFQYMGTTKYPPKARRRQRDKYNSPDFQDLLQEVSAGATYSHLQNMKVNLTVPMKMTIDYPGATDLTKCRYVDEAGNDRLPELSKALIGDSPDKDMLWNSVDNGLKHVDEEEPYVETAMDTVICLDTSESLTGEPFHKMKQAALDFINGVEDVVEERELEENIGLVTFGGRAQIIHPLSNDYGSLRDALEDVECGGASPLHEGVLLSLACLSKGGELDIGGIVQVPPRIIVMTDGLATGIDASAGGDAQYVDERQKEVLLELFGEMKRRQPEDYLQGHVTFVPVGRADRGHLLSLARACGGNLVEIYETRKLSKYQKHHVVAAEALEGIKAKTTDSLLNGVSALALYVQSKLLDEKKVNELVRDNVEKMFAYYDSVYVFNNIMDVPDLPPLGSRVMRGADWKWGNQDTEAVGTIFNHGQDEQYVWVLWDNGFNNVYRYGRDGCFDVDVVHGHPREPDFATDFWTGLWVERGPNWHVTYGDQDGGEKSRGVIIRERQDLKRVKVRWDNGNMYEYRYGEDNLFDISVVDPTACQMESTSI